MSFRKLLAAVSCSILLCSSVVSASNGSAFDRNGDGSQDIYFSSQEEVPHAVQYEGQTQYGFVDTDSDGQLDAIWLDRNADGTMNGRELHALKTQMAWAPLVQLDSLEIAIIEQDSGLNIDYTGDGITDESLLDANKDGFFEEQTLYTVGENGIDPYTLSLIDTDDDLFFDQILMLYPGRKGRLGRSVSRIPSWALLPCLPVFIPETTPDPVDESTPSELSQDTAPLFGFWGLNGYHSIDGFHDVEDRFGVNVFQVASENPSWTVNTFLPMIEEGGMKVTLRMTGDHDYYTTNGNFDLEKWKTRLSTWADSGVQSYIDKGVLVGHMLLDDVHNFEGNGPSFEEYEEMARYSKELLPGLMTFVRCQASTIPSGTYTYLDAIVNQYNSYSNGPIEAYVTTEHAAATERTLGIINGLNIADGGDGSSGQAGWRDGRWAMTGDEILSYGHELIQMPDMMMFLMWEYDGQELWSDGSIGSDYFDQEELRSAIEQLGQEVAAL